MSDEKNSSGESGKLLYCSFCGKSQHEVRKLIAGPSVFICDECVELCNDIIREEVQEQTADRTGLHGRNIREPGRPRSRTLPFPSMSRYGTFILAVLTAIGAAGVPGGSLPLMMLVMATVGVPPEGIAIILGVDRILDMSRTTLNVCGDISASVYVDRVDREMEGLPPAEPRL